MKTIITAIFVFIVLMSFNCSNITDETERDLLPIEGNIVFSIKEIYGNYNEITEPELFLSFSTEKVYPCCNYPIIFCLYLSAHHIVINFCGIEETEFCLCAIGPAYGGYFLDINNGKYDLCFQYENIDDRYIITVSDTSIVISETESDYTKTGYNIYWRYPDNSFAYLCGTKTEDSWICEEFLSILKDSIDIREFQFPEEGKIPYPLYSSGHYYDMPAKYFYYEKEEDFETAGEVLKVYSENVLSQYSGAGISLINWKNKKFYSWKFVNKN